MQSTWLRWFYAMSIRWKLQAAFFLVTMTTIVINRWVGYGELERVVSIARANQGVMCRDRSSRDPGPSGVSVKW